MTKTSFQLYVDTGGTFTDCIGIDSDSKQYRQKVLSSSCLRSTIVKVLSENTCEIAEAWNLTRDIFPGFSFRLLGEKSSEVKIESFDVKTKILRLSEVFLNPEMEI